MTPHILRWLSEVVLRELPETYSVVEIGSLNVNGSARDVLGPGSSSWLGYNLSPGPGVDVVGRFEPKQTDSFDIIVCCECLEHDPEFWKAVNDMHASASASSANGRAGLLCITTPTIMVPYHNYDGDFYRFTKDAYRRVLFPPSKFDLLALHETGGLPAQAICGLGKYIT